MGDDLNSPWDAAMSEIDRLRQALDEAERTIAFQLRDSSQWQKSSVESAVRFQDAIDRAEAAEKRAEAAEARLEWLVNKAARNDGIEVIRSNRGASIYHPVYKNGEFLGRDLITSGASIEETIDTTRKARE